ncbi:MAG: fatty acid desaturase [Alphaproteobacteria bacterium]|nr:fatty acid desaturase [Alphaproteobacteria bacterium]
MSECSLALKGRKARARDRGEAPHIRFAHRDTNSFRQALNGRVDAYFAANGKTRFADRGFWIEAAVLTAVMLGAYAALLGNAFGDRFGPWGSLVPALVYGLALLVLAMSVAHDAAHAAVTGNGRIDDAIQRAVMGLLGVDGYLWRLRHNGSHHAFPNVNGSDIDIDENPVLRLSPNHPWKPHYRFQHLYAPFAYMLTLWDSIFVNDLKYLFKRDLANMRGIVHPRREHVKFWLFKLLYLTVNLILPLAFVQLPWWQILLGYALVNAAVSLVFVVLLVGTHFSLEADFPAADAAGRLDTSWAAHAVSTALNWSTRSRIAFHLTGGVNCHAAHHLYPRVNHVHYWALTRIAEQTAREHGLTFHEASFTGMIASHFAHLRRLGRGPVPPRNGGWWLRMSMRIPPKLLFGVYRAFY